jgi:integrase
MTTPAKRGRKAKDHKCTWDGTTVNGLYRKPGTNVWRVRETGQEFTEPDEREAVSRFRKITGTAARAKIHIPTAIAKSGDNESVLAALELLRSRRPPKATKSPEDFSELVSEPSTAPIGRIPNLELVDGRLEFYQGAGDVDADTFWRWLRNLILTQGELIAQKTGVAWMAWGPDLRPPTASPPLADLIETYANKAGISPEEISRVKRYWKEFTTIVGVKTIREITHDHAEQYEAKLAEGDLAPKSIKHRYSGVRTVIAYAMKRGKGTDDCRHTLDILAMLEIEHTNSLDPNPITPEDFWKVHAAAEKAGDKVFAAMLLMALNAALYSSEAGAVRWDEIDLSRGEFVTRRNKTRVPRVAVLWPETIKALKSLPRERETVFNTTIQAYNRFSAHRTWTRYRIEAKVKGGVTFAQIRDGSFTTACRVSLDQAKILAGHRLSGATDNYVLRNPQFVAEVCAAIRHAYVSKVRPKKSRGN